jgi:hypothetical protein
VKDLSISYVTDSLMTVLGKKLTVTTAGTSNKTNNIKAMAPWYKSNYAQVIISLFVCLTCYGKLPRRKDTTQQSIKYTYTESIYYPKNIMAKI